MNVAVSQPQNFIIGNEFFRLIADRSLTGIFVSQGDVLLYANPRLATLLGIEDVETYFGGSFVPFVHADDREMVLARLAARMRGEAAPNHYELRLVRPSDGAVVWFELLVTHLTYGDQFAVMGNLVDVTARKAMEAQLIRNDERYRDLFDHAAVGLFRIDAKTRRIVDCNERVARMMGYDDSRQFRDQFVASLDIFDDQAREAARRARDEIRNLESRLFRRNGSPFWARLSFRRDVEAGCWEGVVTDVTEEKQAAEALKESEELLRMLLESADDMIFLQDTEGRYLYFNAASRSCFRSEQLLGRRPADVLDADAAERVAERLRQVVRTGEPISAETRVVLDGRERWLSDRLSAVRNDGGAVTAVVTVSRDITARKQADAERQTLEEQLLHAQKMEAVGTLVGGIAHDFNNLLTGIMGNLELAERYAGDSVQPFLIGASKTAARAADLVKQILTFSRKNQPERKCVKPARLLEETYRIVRETIDRRIQLDDDVGEGIWPVYGDPGQFQQVLMNLAINSRDAVAERWIDASAPPADAGEPRIRIALENRDIGPEYVRSHTYASTGQFVALVVEDNGTGMAPEVAARIFDPFFTTKQPGIGTGLGLATVFGIVKRHDGWIEVTSTPDRGSTFRAFFPRFPGEAPAEEAKPSILDVPGGDETILLVDDEQMIRDLGESILTRSGYTVVVAEDGRQGIQTYYRERERIDLVILDLTMPYLSGWEVLEQIRELDPDQKVLLSSGFSVDLDKRDLKQLDRVDFVAKPYHLDELAAKVRQILDGGKSK